MQREKGSLISKSCEGCAASLSLVKQADGSTAYENCGNCFPAKAKQTAPKPPSRPAPEVASKAVVIPAREVGTSTEENQ